MTEINTDSISAAVKIATEEISKLDGELKF